MTTEYDKGYEMGYRVATLDASRRTLDGPCSTHPVIVLGWPTIARIIHGKAVSLRDAELLPSDEIMNEAMRISMSESNAEREVRT